MERSGEHAEDLLMFVTEMQLCYEPSGCGRTADICYLKQVRIFCTNVELCSGTDIPVKYLK